MCGSTYVRELVVSAHIAGRTAVGAAAGLWEVCSGDLADQPLSRRHIVRIVHRGRHGQDKFSLRLDQASVGICRQLSRRSNFASCSNTQIYILI